MKTRTFLRAALTRVAILTGILVGLTLFINLPVFDEDLHEDIARLTVPEDVSLEGNAFALAVGFLAPADQDPREMGLSLIQAQREQFRTNGYTSMPPGEVRESLPDPRSSPGVSKVFEDFSCNPKVDLDCVDRLNTSVVATPVEDAQVRLLLTRFERILQEPRYEEVQEFDFRALPAYVSLATISRLRLAESFRDADTAGLLQAIGEDSRFWKRMLEGADTLIAKMVSLAGLRHDAMALSTLMRTRQLGEEHLRQIPGILPPLTEGERNIEEAFMAESRLVLLGEGGFSALTGSSLPFRLVSQDNATINEYYIALMLPLRSRASLSAQEFYRQKAYEPVHHPMRLVPPPLYNLGGKQFVRRMVEENNWQDYIARVHDVDGRIAQVLLQAEIALNGEKSVEDVVRASRYRNPYTGEPMAYDAEAGTISFECLGIGEGVCALRIR